MARKNMKEDVVEAEVVSETKQCCGDMGHGERGGIFWGLILVAVGVVLIAETIVNINLWQYFWPGVLIIFGLSLLVRSFRR